MQEIECKGVFSITRHRKIKNKTPKQNKLTQAVAGTSRQHQRPSSCVVPGEKANAAMPLVPAAPHSWKNGSKARVRVGAPPSTSEDGFSCCCCPPVWSTPSEA